MSRFMKYASNLLDGVDSIAKGSLTDQDIAAAAAERRRRRKQSKLRENRVLSAAGSAAEQSEGDLSGDSSAYNDTTPGSGRGSGGVRTVREARLQSGEQSDSFEEGGESTADEGIGYTNSSKITTFHAADFPEGGRRGGGEGEGGENEGGTTQSQAAASFAATTFEAGTSSGAERRKGQQQQKPGTTLPTTSENPTLTAVGFATTTASADPPGSPVVRSVFGGSSAGSKEEATAVAVEKNHPTISQRPTTAQGYYPRETTPGVLAGGGTAGKEDGSMWSDKDASSSPAPSPTEQGSQRQRRGQAYTSGGVIDGKEASTAPSSPSERPYSLGAASGSLSPGGVVSDEGGNGYGGGEEDEGETDSVSNANSTRVYPSTLSPVGAPLLNPQQRKHQHEHRAHGGAAYNPAGLTSTETAAGTASVPFETVVGDNNHAAAAAAGRERDKSSSITSRAGAKGASGNGSRGDSPSASGSAAPRTIAGYNRDSGPHSGSGVDDVGGSGSNGQERRRRGLGSLLSIGSGAKKAGGGSGGLWGNSGDGAKEAEALKVEVVELRAEVEELSLELEDAEDRLIGQEAELKTAADTIKRQKASGREREKAMEAEMEDFRGLQRDEKKVFLSNLESMEQKLKEKERQVEEAKSALSALETFAMERDDEVTRFSHEKEELLEELKGARSGQDRSNEEIREALTRAEAEAEEVEARHRAWMRQAQARQTELEATAAQLAEALADANRKITHPREESQPGTPSSELSQRARASNRELRAFRDELESCEASLELEQERTRALQQEVTGLQHDLDTARATEAMMGRQRQEHANMAAESFAKASRLEQQLQQEQANAHRLQAPAIPSPAGAQSQIQILSSKLLDKQSRLEESICERATLSAKLKEASRRASRAEQELREFRGESLESGADFVGERMRPRRRQGDKLGVGRGLPTGSWSRITPIAKHKQIASAVDVLDRNTLQAVVFLRNSSPARAIFLGYLLLLHFFASVLLCFHSFTMLQPLGLNIDD